MQCPPIATRPTTTADAEPVAAMLARAFVDDPVLGHIFPDPASRPRRQLAFFRLIVRAEANPADTIVAGETTAATIWRPPGQWAIPTRTMLGLAVPMLAALGTALPRALRLQAVVDAHHPREPHWYLAFAGCDPAFHGRGFGGAAIRAKLRECDSAGLPAALETANEANIAVYAALGFRVTDRFDGAPGLRFWSMWRDPS